MFMVRLPAVDCTVILSSCEGPEVVYLPFSTLASSSEHSPSTEHLFSPSAVLNPKDTLSCGPPFGVAVVEE
ncbi:hypothetical protein LshimejAT787_1205070 [Lyophyllum shimeji]|uniref:Uncharacterized protein n=1 Tax=Lyophyllum shimeji TaxID=47721 RepID=A0A9P3URW1_LYOSH|nr:hypothetical protein LshimejAT787_1205070 [Lyophyllum shimeji]